MSLPTNFIPKLVIFGSISPLISKGLNAGNTIWTNSFEAVDETKSYHELRKDFRKKKFSAPVWAHLSNQVLIDAKLPISALTAISDEYQLRAGAIEMMQKINSMGAGTALISGGFATTDLAASYLAGLDQSISQANPHFIDGKLASVHTLNTDYSHKVNFARTIANTSGVRLKDCLFIGSGEGSIPLAKVMPSIAVNSPHGRHFSASFDLDQLYEYFATMSIESAIEANQERILPGNVLLGNPASDSVLLVYDENPENYSGLLDKFAAIGPLLTNKPGVNEFLKNIRGTGINTIYTSGTPSVFKPCEELDAQTRTKNIQIKSLENNLIETGTRDQSINFMHKTSARRVYSSPFVPEDISFVVFKTIEGTEVDVYRNREKIDSVIGNNRAVLESVVASYGERVSPENQSWLSKTIFSEQENTEISEFTNLADAQKYVIQTVLADNVEYKSEKGELAKETKNISFKINNVGNLKPLVNEAINKEINTNYVNQFMGIACADQFDYDIWARIEPQINDVVEKLANSSQTRRAHLTVAEPSDVLKTNWGNAQPCHHALDFYVQDGKLSMTAIMRTNDATRALAPDIYAAVQLQKKIANDAGLKVGDYTHFSVRTQIFQRDYHVVEKLLK